MNAKRNITIDIMKGLLIILMVAGHAQVPIHRFIYLFHMPAFFLISGWLYKSTDNGDLFFIKRKLKGLYKPYVKWNLICLAILIAFPILQQHDAAVPNTLGSISANVIKIFAFRGRTILSDTSWFVYVLFFATIIYNFVSKRLSAIQVGGVICVSFIVTYYVIPNKFEIDNIGSALLLLWVGHLLRVLYNSIGQKYMTAPWILLLTLVSATVLTALLFFTDKELRLIDNELIAPSYFIVASLAGFTFIGCISKIITKLKFLSHSLAYVGRHTLIILFTHIIVFKIVGLLQIYFYELNISEISNYPICYKDSFSWIYYTIAGMGLPLLYEFIGNKAALYNERRKQSKTCSE